MRVKLCFGDDTLTNLHDFYFSDREMKVTMIKQ